MQQDQALAALAKVGGNSKKLLEAQYASADAVRDAGAIAYECGEKAGSVANLEVFTPSLEGSIRYTIKAQANNQAEQHGPWNHFFNKMVEGFAKGGNIKTEEDAIACAHYLVKDDGGWRQSAERALVRAAVPVMQSDDAIDEFGWTLMSDRAVIMFSMLLNRAGKAKFIPKGTN